MLIEIGKVKRHKYPLPVLTLMFPKRFGFKRTHQWCFAYKMFKIGWLEIYYFQPEQ